MPEQANMEVFLNSLDESRLHTSFTLLAPTLLGDEVPFVGAWYFRRSHPVQEGESLDYITLYYDGDGKHIAVRQGFIGLPEAKDVTPADAHGTVQIQGKPAIWRDGVRQGDGWVRGLLSIGWQPNRIPVEVVGQTHVIGPETDPGLPLTCAVLGQAAEVTLAELIEIAESVSVYSSR